MKLETQKEEMEDLEVQEDKPSKTSLIIVGGIIYAFIIGFICFGVRCLIKLI